MSSAQPKAGVQYPIVLGESFLNRSDNADYSTLLRLDFIPASCDRISQGNLHIDPDNMATLSLPNTNSNGNSDTVEFQGKSYPSKDELDCVAIFDATTQTFKLELLSDGQATLKHMPGSKRDKKVRGLDNSIAKSPAKEKKSSAPPPPAAAAVVAKNKTRKPAAAAAVPAVSQEEIADDFFHGALD